MENQNVGEVMLCSCREQHGQGQQSSGKGEAIREKGEEIGQRARYLLQGRTHPRVE